MSSRDVRPFSMAMMEKADYSLDAILRAAAHSTSAMTEHCLT